MYFRDRGEEGGGERSRSRSCSGLRSKERENNTTINYYIPQSFLSGVGGDEMNNLSVNSVDATMKICVASSRSKTWVEKKGETLSY